MKIRTRHRCLLRINLPGACVIFALIFSMVGCGTPVVPLPGVPASSLSVGEWRGSTAQGMPIAFTVSGAETVTSLTLGYNFNDCLGTLKFEEIDVPTAPNVTCIPGPCRGSLVSYRAFSFANGSPAGGSYTQVNGLFLPRSQAQGQVIFSGFPECGDATVEWTATRR